MAVMNADPDQLDPTHRRTAIQRRMRCLGGFSRGLSLDKASARGIIENVAAEMLMRTDEEHMIEAAA